MTDETATPKGHEISVNEFGFREPHSHRTGLQLKEDAIAAGARLRLTYVLEEETHGGNVRIGDDQVVAVHSGLEFVAHPGGSDS